IAPEQESPGPANLQSKPEEKAAPAPIAEARPQSVSSPLPTRTPLPAEAAVETVRQSAQTNESPRVAARAEPSTRSVPDPQAPVQGPSSPLQVSRPSPAPQIPPLSVAVEPSHADFGALRGQALPLEPPTRNERTVPLAAVEPVRPAIEPVKAMPDLPLPPRRAEPEAAAEFERMLDAEISGDLQRLAPTAQPRPEIRPAAAGRQEPILGSPLQDSRKEPTIEEEMERMLSDISAGRKL
ncbi:histidine kinase, partial [Sinorhizobium medicae]